MLSFFINQKKLYIKFIYYLIVFKKYNFMSKFFCKECKAIYNSKESDKASEKLKPHNYILVNDNNFMEIMLFLCQYIKSFDKKMNQTYKDESELLYRIQENRLLINFARGETQCSYIYPKFELLNCKSTQNKNSYCLLYRTQNIVYMTIKFEGKIEEVEILNFWFF